MLWKTLLVAWACGVVMHFLYRPLGQPRFLRALFPVSENVWEHFKMAFWPLCGAMAFVGAFLTIRAAADPNRGTGTKVFVSAVILLGCWVFVFVLAILLGALMAIG